MNCLPTPAFALPVESRTIRMQSAEGSSPQLRSAIKQNSPAVLLHRFRLLQKVDVLAELAELECPLAYVQATRDRLVPKRCLSEIRKAKPDIIVHEIEGPHLIIQTQAKLAWRKIVEDTSGLI